MVGTFMLVLVGSSLVCPRFLPLMPPNGMSFFEVSLFGRALGSVPLLNGVLFS